MKVTVDNIVFEGEPDDIIHVLKELGIPIKKETSNLPLLITTPTTVPSPTCPPYMPQVWCGTTSINDKVLWDWNSDIK